MNYRAPGMVIRFTERGCRYLRDKNQTPEFLKKNPLDGLRRSNSTIAVG